MEKGVFKKIRKFIYIFPLIFQNVILFFNSSPRSNMKIKYVFTLKTKTATYIELVHVWVISLDYNAVFAWLQVFTWL